ncbi:MAG: hypothetical protein EA362_05920 [Saprospirales bacterium]|nr:MAG: hypothetical protein EA362_05920 [Saprospirales bacterium]
MTKRKLTRLEQKLKIKGVKVVYAKGNFSSGYCRLREEGVALVNKFFDIKGRILSLEEILKEIEEEEE